jgi:2-dehydro-3-deoxygluconokinase
MTAARARRPRVVTLGETLALFRSAETGSLRHATGLTLGVGGAESNVAIALARLGVDASWLGRIGDDPLGERVAREVRAEGVDARVVVDPVAPTGLMVKERARGESSRVLYYRSGSAGSRLEPDDIPDGWVEEADLLHVSGITPLLSATARAAISAAVARARAAGVAVSVDVNYRSSLGGPDEAGSFLAALAPQAAVVFGSPGELALLRPGRTPEEAAVDLVTAGCGEVVLKRGDRGATSFSSGATPVSAPAFPVRVVDTVGAGDAFVASYLHGLLADAPVAERLERANACGALACLGPGDWETSPTSAELERFLQRDVDPVER